MSKLVEFVESASTAQTRAPAYLVEPVVIAQIQLYEYFYSHCGADQMMYSIDQLYCGLGLKALQVEMDEIKVVAAGGSIKNRVTYKNTAKTLSHFWIAMAGSFSGRIERQATALQKKADVCQAMRVESANFQITTDEMAQRRTLSSTSLEFIKTNVKLAG